MSDKEYVGTLIFYAKSDRAAAKAYGAAQAAVCDREDVCGGTLKRRGGKALDLWRLSKHPKP